MASSVNNFVFWVFRSQLLLVSLLLLLLGFRALAQETQPTLEAAMALNEPAARLAALQKFLQAQPDAPQADAARAELTRVYAYLGEMQLADKNVDEAIQNFKQAIAAFPKQIDDQFFAEVASRIPLAVSVRGYRTEAILLAREMEARFRTEAARLAQIGEFYLSLEASTEALRALQAASKLEPDNARIYRALGAAYRVNLDLDKAADQYTAAIKADPKESRAYFELANLQRARGRYEVAINLYTQQLSLEPEHLPSVKALALCYLAQGKDDRASEWLEQAAKLASSDLARDFYWQTQLALTHLARGNVTKARQAADTAVAAEPRFSWARIAAAEVDLAEGKYFESERNLIATMKYADFPTLHFTLGKIYLAVEDFEGALEEFGKAFSYKAGKFQTRLGGVQEVTAATVAELLAPERQASLFQAEPITTEVEFKLAENLLRFETALRTSKQPSSQLVSAILMSQKSNQLASVEVEKAAQDFVETEGSRKPFRWLYTAERLTQTGQSLETVLKLTDQALEVAEAATAPEGSLRDYPNYDGEGRLRVFRGRALTLRGRALIKLNRPSEAIATLEQAIESYGLTPERKRAQWQLALAQESAGQIKEALDLYIVAYDPPDKNAIGSDLNRTVIESLYRKVYGSLDGLNDRIGKARETALAANVKPLASTTAPLSENLAAANPTEVKTPEKTEAKPTESTPPEAVPAAPTPVTSNVENKPELAAEKIAAEVITITRTTSEAPPEVASVSPIRLPEARLVALASSELPLLALLASAQTLQSAEEDAPPPATPATTNSETATTKTTEGVSTGVTTVLLPMVKPISLVLPDEFVRGEIPPDLRLGTEVEDAPLPDKTSATTAVVTARTEEIPAATEKKTELSDARVAEIEKAITAETGTNTFVGKKGNSTSTLEETINGHREGDTPLRIVPVTETGPPAGESGPDVPKTPSVIPDILPAEVEQRAKAMGQSAGKLSAGAAVEVENERPAGQGRKGTRNAEEVEEEDAKPKPSARPRRVKEEEPKPKSQDQ